VAVVGIVILIPAIVSCTSTAAQAWTLQSALTPQFDRINVCAVASGMCTKPWNIH